MLDRLDNWPLGERIMLSESQPANHPPALVSVAVMLRAFIRMVDAKDPHTREHSERVASYAAAISRRLGYTAQAEERVRWSALLHDIGKLAIPNEVLRKPDRLSPDEWALMHQHPLESVRLLADIPALKACLPAIRQHHERLDGLGYPDRLGGREISLDARILAVADAFDAMTSPRAYQPALSEVRAFAELQAGAGSQFDLEVVRSFASLFGERCQIVVAQGPNSTNEDVVIGERVNGIRPSVVTR